MNVGGESFIVIGAVLTVWIIRELVGIIVKNRTIFSGRKSDRPDALPVPAPRAAMPTNPELTPPAGFQPAGFLRAADSGQHVLPWATQREVDQLRADMLERDEQLRDDLQSATVEFRGDLKELTAAVTMLTAAVAKLEAHFIRRERSRDERNER